METLGTILGDIVGASSQRHAAVTEKVQISSSIVEEQERGSWDA